MRRMVDAHVIHVPPPSIPQAMLDGLAAAGATTVYEALGRTGAMTAAIKPIEAGMTVCGPALTVKLRPGDNLMMHRAVSMARAGEVIVCDVGAWEGGPWGELLTAQAMAHGARGLVIDGFVRDASAIAEMGFAVFARGLSMNGTDKRQLGWINHPIMCGGAAVRPGDIVVGDRDGVVVVPLVTAAQALERARQRELEEAEARKRFLAGETSWKTDGFSRTAAELRLTEDKDSRAIAPLGREQHG
jgi:4-hydroxy-4-methyl-2-oxoglutarate aldolase